MHLGLEIADGSRTKLRYHMPEAAGLQKWIVVAAQDSPSLTNSYY
jgi:hypothetical protein